MKYDYLIFYEHASRELETDCYLASILKKRGYSVKIINRRYLWRIFLNPKVIITPFLYSDTDVHEFTGFLNGRKRTIVNLQFEQILNDEGIKSDFYRLSGSSRQAIHICWGNNTRNRLLETNVPEEQLPICGAISLDFNRPQLRPLLKDKIQLAREFGLDENKKWHLFISSFSLCSMTQENIDIVDKKIPGYAHFAKISQSSQDGVIKWIKEMANRHPEILFIYRPHPNEHETPKIKALEQYSNNIRIIPDYSIRQWVNICETSSCWISTSIADSFFADRPCCVLRPSHVPVNFDPKIFVGARFISDTKDYDNYLSSDSPEVSALDEKVFSDLYLTDKSMLFGERVADECEKALHGKTFPYKRYWKDCFTSFKYDVMAFFFRLFPVLGCNEKSRFYDFHRMAENTRHDNILMKQYTERFRTL